MGWVSKMVTQLFMDPDVIAFDLWAKLLSVAFRLLENGLLCILVYKIQNVPEIETDAYSDIGIIQRMVIHGLLIWLFAKLSNYV